MPAVTGDFIGTLRITLNKSVLPGVLREPAAGRGLGLAVIGEREVCVHNVESQPEFMLTPAGLCDDGGDRGFRLFGASAGIHALLNRLVVEHQLVVNAAVACGDLWFAARRTAVLQHAPEGIRTGAVGLYAFAGVGGAVGIAGLGNGVPRVCQGQQAPVLCLAVPGLETNRGKDCQPGQDDQCCYPKPGNGFSAANRIGHMLPPFRAQKSG